MIERTLIRPFDPADHLPLVIITLGSVPGDQLRGRASSGSSTRVAFPSIFPEGNALKIGNAALTWNTVVHGRFRCWPLLA